MIRVLIVDDESIVLESIKYILLKNFSDIEVDTASSGAECLQKLIMQSFHLVFIDIQMPDMNGIEVIEEYKKIKNESFPFFVIISAHDKFEYARKSIDLGAFSYILKPYSISDIVEATKSAIGEINKVLSKQLEEIEKKKKIKAMQSVIENTFALIALNSKLFPEFNLKWFEEILQLSYSKTAFVIVLKHPEQNSLSSVEMLNSLKNELKSTFSNKCLVSFVSVNTIVCIFFSEDSSYKNLLKERIQKIIDKNYEKDIEMGISNLCNIYEEFEFGFYEAYSNMLNEGYDDTADVYLDLELIEKKLLNIFAKTVHPHQLKSITSDMVKKYIQAYGFVQAKYKVIIFVILLLIEVNIKENSFLPTTMEKFIKDVLLADSESDLNNIFFDVAQAIYAEMINQRKLVNSAGIISQAIEYINNNFTKNITLDEISKIFNISPYYFSKIFKKTMGINFKEYLIKLKIEHALKLIKETNMSIKEISYAVGFDDPNYFVKAFKKWTGFTPSSLRNQK